MSIPTAQVAAVSLDQPLYGATVAQAFVRFWKKYATFSGRASRSEYWWVALISLVVSALIYLIELAASGWDPAAASATFVDPGDILNYSWSLATLIPSIAITVRRLHDVDKAGWWILIGLIPLVGWVVLIVWNASPSNPAGVRFDR